MKCLVKAMAQSNYLERAVEKIQISNHYRVRGTISLPEAPRDVFVQSANGGVLVTWKLPVFHTNVAGWRVYVNTESNLAVQIRDKGTRQAFIPLGSDTVAPTVNIMVSAFTTLGRESSKVVKQGSPATQTGPTTVPTVPPGYTQELAGGKNRQLITFNGVQAYVK